MKAYQFIDGHQHAVPTKEEIPESIRRNKYFDIEDRSGKLFMTQGFINWSRPVSNEIFFVNQARFDLMEKTKMAHAIILVLSQLYCNGISKADTYEIISFQNDYNLSLEQRFPSKFTCGFVVNPRYLDQALKEMEKRAAQGFTFLCLPTHYELRDGKFTSCTDKNCQAIFELAEKLNLAIQFHPYDYEKIMMNLEDIEGFWAGHIVGLPFLTAHFHYQLTCKSLHIKYPGVRFYLSHANVLAIATMGRKTQAFDGRPDYFSDLIGRPEEALFAPNIFFDNITHDPEMILYIKAKCRTENMFEGSDYPYPLGQGVTYVKGREHEYPGFMLDIAQTRGYITPEENYQMSCKNVTKWLCGSDAQKALQFEKRIGLIS